MPVCFSTLLALWHNVDLLSVQGLGDDCFVAFHDEPILHCPFVSVGKDKTDSMLEHHFLEPGRSMRFIRIVTRGCWSVYIIVDFP